MVSLPLAAVIASGLASAVAGTDGFCQCEAKPEYPFAAAFCQTYAYTQQACDSVGYCQYDCGCSCAPTPAYDPSASGYCAYMSADLPTCLSANPAVCEVTCPASETVMSCACAATQFYDPAASSYCASFDTEEACAFASPGVCEYACEAQCGCVAEEAYSSAAAFCAQFTESEGQCEQAGGATGVCRYSPCSVDGLSFATRARAAAELAWFDHQGALALGGAAAVAALAAAAALVVRRRRAAAQHKYAALPTEGAALLAA